MTVTETNSFVPGIKNSEGTVLRASFMPAAHNHTQSEVIGLETALSGKASSSHTHTQSDVTGLADALNGKAAASHTHAISDITNLSNSIAAIGARIDGVEGSKADASNVYSKSAVDSALSALNDITVPSSDVSDSAPLDLSALKNGELCYLHTSDASLKLSECITSSISGTTIHYLGSDGDKTNRNYVIRKHRMGTHLFVEVIAAY